MTIGRIPSVEGGIQPTIMDAKGDLLAATAADTPARLAVGNNGETLLADSSTTTGLRWQGQFMAGKNAIINGDFRIWQRGTSFTANGYTADRWLTAIASTSGFSVSQQTFTPGTAPLSGYEGQFFVDIAGTITSATAGFIQLTQRIEDVRTFAGQTVTLSFWAKGSANGTINTLLVQNFGTGGSAAVLTTTNNHSLTTSWQRFSVTYTVPSVSGKTIGTGSFLDVYFVKNMGTNFPTYGSSNYTGTLSLWGVQVEAGSVATPFTTATGTIQGELAACQRYYFRINGNSNYNPVGTGYAKNTTAADGFIPIPTMRIAPTSVDFTNLQVVDGATVFGSTGLTLGGASTNMARVDMTGFTGLTANRPYSVVLNNTSNQFLGFSAEL